MAACSCTSLPSRGAWIEMRRTRSIIMSPSASLPSRGAWIEILQMQQKRRRKASLPSRGAWIEIR